MAISLKDTAELSQKKVNILAYGESGSGKTTAIKTLPRPVVLSAEGGLLSISDAQIPYIEIKSVNDLLESYEWLISSDEAKQFQSVAIDSISEIGEVLLATEKKTAKDKRMAYGEMNDQISEIVRNFRDIPNKHVYMTAKLDKTKDEMGRLLYAPSMPGSRSSQSLPYYFDECLAFRSERDENNHIKRAIMTSGDGLWMAKDRSGKLSTWEPMNLGALIEKIKGVQDV